MPSKYCNYKNNMRLFERKRQEFAMRHEYEKLQKAKTAGKNSKNSSTLALNPDTNRSKSPKRMVIRVGRDEYKPEPLELHHISEDEMSNSPPPSKRSKKSAYEEWKAEKGLDSEEPVKKSDKKRIEELENRNQELERELEDSKKRHRDEIDFRNQYQDELRDKIAILEKKVAHQGDKPYKKLLEKFITNEFNMIDQLKPLHSEASKILGSDNFDRLVEIGSKSLESGYKNKRFKKSDLENFAKRKIKDIPVYDSEMQRFSRLEGSGRIQANGLYGERLC